MKGIPLANGAGVALVDDEDYERLSEFTWKANRRGKTIYAIRSTDRHHHVKMHRDVLGFGIGDPGVDHINGNGLDNRKKNLRVATPVQNGANSRPRTDSASPFKGVTFHKGDGQWHARIRVDGDQHFLGAYESERDAAIAYNGAARALSGDRAWLNVIPGAPDTSKYEVCGTCWNVYLTSCTEEYPCVQCGVDDSDVKLESPCHFTPSRWQPYWAGESNG